MSYTSTIPSFINCTLKQAVLFIFAWEGCVLVVLLFGIGLIMIMIILNGGSIGTVRTGLIHIWIGNQVCHF